MEPTDSSGLRLALALDLLCDRWMVEMVGLLESGPCPKGNLQDRLAGASGIQLSLTLRRMERDGLVECLGDEGSDEPYGLTELGRTLIVPIKVVRDWADQHFSAVIKNRQGRHNPG